MIALKELESGIVTLKSAAHTALELGANGGKKSRIPCSIAVFKCSGICPVSSPIGTEGKPNLQAVLPERKTQADMCSSEGRRVSPQSMYWQDTQGPDMRTFLGRI